MSSDLARAIAQSGAIDESMLRELNKWKLPGVVVPSEAGFTTPEEALEAIEEAMTSANQVEVRVTDLDILKNFLQTRRSGKLYVVTEDGTKGAINVTFGTISRRNYVDYIIPWNNDSIETILTNGESYLLDDKKKVFFSAVMDLYFEDTKAFMVCTPIREGNGKRSTDHQG